MKPLAPGAITIAVLLFSGCSAAQVINTGGDAKCKDFNTQDQSKQNQEIGKMLKDKAALIRTTWRSRQRDCPRRPVAKRWASQTARSLKRHTANRVAAAISRNRLGLGECPLVVDNFVVRSVQPDQVVPSRCGRQAVRRRSVALAELNGDVAVGAALGGDVVQ